MCSYVRWCSVRSIERAMFTFIDVRHYFIVISCYFLLFIVISCYLLLFIVIYFTVFIYSPNLFCTCT